ncbi:hypothetical protein [Breoghania sp.]|uniref:hypothetical protein n=1 Tax=Breoghania sp. TaxID=2065378 RepID=UPI00261B30D9|nr:hypothetical protein [Breoghania sp.]MDJ0933410.1 hypothetical protein [Breoghania sp.]
MDVQETSGGFHTPAFLSNGIDESAVVEQAREKNVRLASLSRYCLEPIRQKGLVLGFGCASPDDIRNGIEVIRQLPALCPQLV